MHWEKRVLLKISTFRCKETQFTSVVLETILVCLRLTPTMGLRVTNTRQINQENLVYTGDSLLFPFVGPDPVEIRRSSETGVVLADSVTIVTDRVSTGSYLQPIELFT